MQGSDGFGEVHRSVVGRRHSYRQFADGSVAFGLSDDAAGTRVWWVAAIDGEREADLVVRLDFPDRDPAADSGLGLLQDRPAQEPQPSCGNHRQQNNKHFR